MTEIIDQVHTETSSTTDVVADIHRVLQQSSEPLTISKIRSQLAVALRSISIEELGDALQRQVAANVLQQFPKYRSQQDRYWDRPMVVHVAALIHSTVEEEALAWSELRRKLPLYAQTQAESVLQDQLAQGLLHRHPRIGRGGERYGVRRPDPRDYLRTELIASFGRLEKLGFSQEQLRSGALELLHEEEWATVPNSAVETSPAPADENAADPIVAESSAQVEGDSNGQAGAGETLHG